MGADQSSQTGGELRSQRDEDIPYTSYTLSKPIDGETPKSSPRASKGKGANKEAGKDAAAKHEIIVVAEGTSSTQGDSELKKLEEVPLSLPILRSSLNLPHDKHMHESLDKLDTRQLLQLCARYQEHLKQCAEAVAFDQNALCVRIKEIDFAANTLYNQLTERQRRFAKYAEQIQKIQEMQTTLNKVKMNVEQTVPLMERLNSVLPPEDQLEPFTMKTK